MREVNFQNSLSLESLRSSLQKDGTTHFHYSFIFQDANFVFSKKDSEQRKWNLSKDD